MIGVERKVDCAPFFPSYYFISIVHLSYLHFNNLVCDLLAVVPLHSLFEQKHW